MRWIGLMLLIATVACPALAQNSVILRKHARLSPDSPVRVSDLATLSGPDGEAIGGVEFSQDVGALLSGEHWYPVTADAIREAIERADPDAAWGFIQISGSACYLGVQREADRVTQVSKEPTSEPKKSARADIRDLTIKKLAKVFDIAPERIRATFRPSDEAVLDIPVLGRRVTVVPLGMSASMPIRLRLYEQNGSLREWTVRASIEVERQVVRLSRTVNRGEPLLSTDLNLDTTWLASDVAPADASLAIGAIAKRKLDAGSIVRARDIERPVLVSKGELVRIHMLSGALVIESEARALEDGREGETIELEPTLGSGRFRAVVRGRGRAMITLGTQTSEQPKTAESARVGGVQIISK